MAETMTGRLAWKKTKSGGLFELHWEAAGKQKSLTVQKKDQIAAPLRALEGKDGSSQVVEFELEAGQPRRIRAAGTAWPEPVFAPAPARADGQDARPSLTAHEFHNPYNFIPAVPRARAKEGLQDQNPTRGAGHDRARPGTWCGTLRVMLETVTPLVIPDAANATVLNGHKTFSIRRDPSDPTRPLLPATTVKGMLRLAYEAITDSRFGVLEAHDRPLAFRMATTEGLKMVPARVEEVGPDRLVLQLLPGSAEPDADGSPRRGSPLYAAWMPAYTKEGASDPGAPSYPGGPKHGERVRAQIQLAGTGVLKYWKVVSLSPWRPGEPGGLEVAQRGEPNSSTRTVDGWVCKTGRNIDRKKYERVFFVDPNHPRRAALKIRLEGAQAPKACALQLQWRQLIEDYQTIHKDEIEEKQLPSPPALENCEWSRHVPRAAKAEELTPGALCYAQVRVVGASFSIDGLFPVSISRALHRVSPDKLLDETLKPARSLNALSPADRVFGWVNQTGPGAWRGRIGVGPVWCETSNAIKPLGSKGLPLTILGQPKPQQGRFYVASTADGTPLPDGVVKSKAYDQAKGLRGRKVYPHHARLPQGYWSILERDWSQPIERRHREYFRPADPRSPASNRDDQNRTLREWVQTDTRFRFDLQVQDLTAVELGALLWLLELPDGLHHRVGGGKPLGFGSVRLRVDWPASILAPAEEWKRAWMSLEDEAFSPAEAARATITKFQDAVKASSGSAAFDQVSWIRAFVRAARGFEKPVHYPRSFVRPDPKGENYKWFVDNDADGKNGGLRLTLPALAEDEGLPLDPRPRR